MANKSGGVISDRRARAAAIRAAEARRARAISLAIGSIVVVVLLVLALLVVYGIRSSSKKSDANDSTVSGAAPAAVSQAVANVPSAVYDSIGAGTASGAPQPMTGQPSMTAGGKPRVLFVGAEFCPYCAAERWALATALARFGTFSGLGVTRSSSTDEDPLTATLDFKDATYTSKYLSFAPFEDEDRTGQPLQKLSSSDDKLFTSIGGSAFPFVDFAGKYKITGPQFDPKVLAGLDQTQIAKDLSDASSPVTKSVVGSANLVSVALCDLSGGQPTTVCKSKGVLAAAAALKAASKTSK